MRCRLKVFQIPEIHIVRQQFVLDFQREASWTDFSLKGRSVSESALSQRVNDAGEELVRQTLPLETTANGWDKQTHWIPQLHFQDMDTFSRKEQWYTVYDDHPDDPERAPIVCYRVAGQGGFNERFELHKFPFDCQDLHIRIKCSTHSREWPCVRLMQNPKPQYFSEVLCTSIKGHNEFLLQDFYYLSRRVFSEEEKTSEGESAMSHRYPVLVMKLHVERKYMYWVCS